MKKNEYLYVFCDVSYKTGTPMRTFYVNGYLPFERSFANKLYNESDWLEMPKQYCNPDAEYETFVRRIR